MKGNIVSFAGLVLGKNYLEITADSRKNASQTRNINLLEVREDDAGNPIVLNYSGTKTLGFVSKYGQEISNVLHRFQQFTMVGNTLKLNDDEPYTYMSDTILNDVYFVEMG